MSQELERKNTLELILVMVSSRKGLTNQFIWLPQHKKKRIEEKEEQEDVKCMIHSLRHLSQLLVKGSFRLPFKLRLISQAGTDSDSWGTR